MKRQFPPESHSSLQTVPRSSRSRGSREAWLLNVERVMWCYEDLFVEVVMLYFNEDQADFVVC